MYSSSSSPYPWKLLSLGLLWIVTVLAGSQVRAQEGTLAREAIEAGVERIFSSAGQQATKDLMQMGGRQTVETILTKTSEEGGELLVKKAVAYTTEEGPVTLRVLEQQSPHRVINLLDATEKELHPGLLAALERTPDALGPIEDAGMDAVRAVVKYPGTGEVLVSTLGKPGAQAALAVDEDGAIVLARNAKDIAGLPPAEQKSFWTAFRKSPAAVVALLEKSPNLLAVGVAVMGLKEIEDTVNRNSGSFLGLPDPKTGEGLVDRLGKPVSYSVASHFL